MKIKNKGKVHPSPSPSSSSSPSPSPFVISGSTPNRDALSVLNLLPAAILALASILSLQDREVLAYMITRSMKTTTTTTTTNPSSAVNDSSKKKCKKPSNNGGSGGGGGGSHKPPLFDCDCFDCYTCYWFRWDSSPNRELIHQAIEAFEDHLSHGEQSKKINAGRGKRKDKPSRRLSDNPAGTTTSVEESKISVSLSPEATTEEDSGDSQLPSVEDDLHLASPGKADGLEEVVVKKEEAAVDHEYREMMGEEDVIMETEVGVRSTTAAAAAANNHNHKGFARKVMPDVLGLFNSRLWNLWGPNV